MIGLAVAVVFLIVRRETEDDTEMDYGPLIQKLDESNSRLERIESNLKTRHEVIDTTNTVDGLLDITDDLLRRAGHDAHRSR